MPLPGRLKGCKQFADIGTNLTSYSEIRHRESRSPSLAYHLPISSQKSLVSIISRQRSVLLHTVVHPYDFRLLFHVYKYSLTA